MMSSLTTFHQFPQLPYELQRYIYILATPPRIVHVRESFPLDNKDELKKEWSKPEFRDDYEAFKERYRVKPLPRLHPDLAYFASNWATAGPFPAGAQTRLEQFGFTAPSRELSGPETERVPQIEPIWLERHLAAAFELLRESHLYSQAPIPPLLHTCRESRTTLMHFGYQLAFGTRTHGARTWFHFGSDILYLHERRIDRDDAAGRIPERWLNPEPQWTYSKLLSGVEWDIGQFDPKDLRRIQRIILAPTCGWDREIRKLPRDLGSFLPLLPCLEELYFQAWGPHDIRTSFSYKGKSEQAVDTIRDTGKSDCFRHGDDLKYPMIKGYDQINHVPQKSKALGSSSRELWRGVPTEQIDYLANLYCSNNLGSLDEMGGDQEHGLPMAMASYNDYEHNHFTVYREIGSADVQVSDSKARELEESSAVSYLARPMKQGGKVTSQAVLKCMVVHVCADSLARRLSEERLSFWHYFMKMKEAYANGRRSMPTTVDAPLPPPLFRPRWKTGPKLVEDFLRGQEMNLHELHTCHLQAETLLELNLFRGWFLEKCPSEPTLEII